MSFACSGEEVWPFLHLLNGPLHQIILENELLVWMTQLSPIWHWCPPKVPPKANEIKLTVVWYHSLQIALTHSLWRKIFDITSAYRSYTVTTSQWHKRVTFMSLWCCLVNNRIRRTSIDYAPFLIEQENKKWYYDCSELLPRYLLQRNLNKTFANYYYPYLQKNILSQV